MSTSPCIIQKRKEDIPRSVYKTDTLIQKFQKAQVQTMKNFYGNEERRIEKLKPVVEIPSELKRKQQQEKKRASKQNDRKK